MLCGCIPWASCEHLAGANDGAAAKHFRACRQIGNVGHASAMHQLQKNLAALFMHGRRHSLPRIPLSRVIKSGNTRIAQAVGTRRGAFGNDQTGCRMLAVVCRHQRNGRMAGRRPAAGHGCHHDAIGKFQDARGVSVEKHGKFSWLIAARSTRLQNQQDVFLRNDTRMPAATITVCALSHTARGYLFRTNTDQYSRGADTRIGAPPLSGPTLGVCS